MALPLCGWGARGKPWRWLLRGRRWTGIYPRYPRYPQAHCAWTDSLFVTALVGGRDDLPATGESLPSHSLSQSQAGRLRVAGQVEAKGRAADEAAARRKLRACPLADAKAAGFESAHRSPGGLRARGKPSGGTPDLRVQDQPGGKRDFGQRAATGEEGASAPDLPGRTGFRPGSCETGGPRTSVHDRQAEPEASAEDPAIIGTKASAEGPRWGEEGREFQTAERRTARASALVGEPAGKPAPASAGKGPRRKRRQDPRFRRRHSKPPNARRLASQARFQQRDSGGRRQRRPPLLFGVGLKAPVGVRGVHILSGQSSRCRPASWQRA